MKCAADFDWDAVVANMVYVWTGLAQAAGLRYYAIPGIGIPHTDAASSTSNRPRRRPSCARTSTTQLIEDPTGFLYNVWLPRVSTEVGAIGEPTTYRNNLALVKRRMAMLAYFTAFGPQIQRLHDECGTVSAIAGILKAPFDIIADKLRGYIGLTMDMATQPDKVLAACEALMPHLTHVGLTTADPRSKCRSALDAPRLRAVRPPEAFQSHYWPTLKPIIEEIWATDTRRCSTPKANGIIDLEDIRRTARQSIVYPRDRERHLRGRTRCCGHKFCLSGGIPNVLLATASPTMSAPTARR